MLCVSYECSKKFSFCKTFLKHNIFLESNAVFLFLYFFYHDQEQP